MNTFDMRTFARAAATTVKFPAGSVVFSYGDPGSCMYIVQSGAVELLIGGAIVDTCGANEALGFMAMIDGLPRTSTARVKEDAELSIIDQRKFRFMVDEIPNFSLYIMGAMAHRIRAMGEVIAH